MGLFTNLIQNAKAKFGDYAFSIGMKKLGGAVVSALIALASSAKVAGVLNAHGVTVDPVTLQKELTVGITGAGVWLHDFLKVKLGVPWL